MLRGRAACEVRMLTAPGTGESIAPGHYPPLRRWSRNRLKASRASTLVNSASWAPPGISKTLFRGQLLHASRACLNSGHDRIWMAVSASPCTNRASARNPEVNDSSERSR